MNPPLFESSVESVILRADTGGVTTLTLNRPAQFNAINAAMLRALQAALDAIGRDDSVRVVVLAGAGRAFCPGHDLKEMLANSNEEFIGGLFRSCCEVMLSLRRLPQPGSGWATLLWPSHCPKETPRNALPARRCAQNRENRLG